MISQGPCLAQCNVPRDRKIKIITNLRPLCCPVQENCLNRATWTNIPCGTLLPSALIWWLVTPAITCTVHFKQCNPNRWDKRVLKVGKECDGWAKSTEEWGNIIMRVGPWSARSGTKEWSIWSGIGLEHWWWGILKNILFEAVSGMYFPTIQTTSCLWYTFHLMQSKS